MQSQSWVQTHNHVKMKKKESNFAEHLTELTLLCQKNNARLPSWSNVASEKGKPKFDSKARQIIHK